MYTALYRKYRPQTFKDVIGQEAIVAALKNQVAGGRVGHAYIFTGTRGTGKTTCAKIFSKAINCLSPNEGDPCGECAVCKSIAAGGVFDIVEIDAASNNGVDDVRELREETVYIPAVCRYKVYIIDEVHMLSPSAFNALLKIMEEPPAHVVFILATTEAHKVPATILSRCQRFDFTRIPPGAIAQRVLEVAQNEQISVTKEAALLLARLADGAMRDALSMLDTCLSTGGEITEETVRAVAGIADKNYLFELSGALQTQEPGEALALLQRVMSRSIEVKRLTEELIYHYRNLLLAGLSSSNEDMLGAGAEYFARYRQAAASFDRAFLVRAIKALGAALDSMGKGADARIELELALLSLGGAAESSEAPKAALPPAPKSSGIKVKEEALQPPAPLLEQELPAPKEENLPTQPLSQEGEASLFSEWPQVVEAMQSRDKLLYANLLGTRAFRKDRRVLIDGSEMFMDYMRQNADSAQCMKEVLEQVTGEKLSIGPYKKPKAATKAEAQQSKGIEKLAKFGVPIEY